MRKMILATMAMITMVSAANADLSYKGGPVCTTGPGILIAYLATKKVKIQPEVVTTTKPIRPADAALWKSTWNPKERK